MFLHQPQSDDQLTNHYRTTDCVKNHLEYLYQDYTVTKSTVDSLQQENHKLAALCEKLRISQIDTIKIQREMNDQLEGLKTPAPFKAASLKESDPKSAYLTAQQSLPPDVEKLIQKFPLLQMKNFHFLFSIQNSWQNLHAQLESEKKQRMKLASEVENLKKMIQDSVAGGIPLMASTPVPSSVASSTIHMAESAYDSFGGDEAEMKNMADFQNAAVEANVEQRLRKLESNYKDLERVCEELKSDKDRCKQLERFVMHLHERIKSLDCGRSGCFIWKITGFDSIFTNAKQQHEAKLKGLPIPDAANSACDFCSPLFYTAPNGYLMYMRLYPYGCDSAAGNFVSLFVALSPGEYDGVLKWPFMHSIEISLLSQEDQGDKWTQVINPGGNNLTCFQRPSSKSGNMSVGILHFIVHK